MEDLKKLIHENTERIVNTRRELHRIPETAFTETKTSEYVARYLKQEGLEVQTGIAKFGVAGLLACNGPGKTLMVRAAMDALTVKEETGLPFTSTHEGAMHACGHDGHMAMALGAVTVLAKLREKMKGNIKFVFQPAEEGPGGAKPMIEAGVMEKPDVDYSVDCHLWPDVPQGFIGVRAGPIMAAMDRFDLKIKGRGGGTAPCRICVSMPSR